MRTPVLWIPGLAGLLLLLPVGTDARGAAPPPPRVKAEVEEVLARSPGPPPEDLWRELNIVLLANEKDHGPHEHDYPLWQKRWRALFCGKESGEKQVNLYGPRPAPGGAEDLAGAPKVRVSTAWNWPAKEQLQSADLIIAFIGTGGRWNPERLNDLEAFLDRGGGFVALHSAVITNRELSKPLAGLIGLAWEDGYTTFRHGPVNIEITAADHAICFGLPRKIRFVDESYWPLVGEKDGVDLLATARERIPGGSGIRPEPMFWTCRRGKGRVFSSILGHYTWTFDDPYFRLLVLRGAAWAAKESPFRFDALVLRGVTFREEKRKTPSVDAERIPVAPDPTDPRLLLWLDAGDKETLTIDPDGGVSAWKNKAGFGRSLASPGGQRPQYIAEALAGLPALRFDGQNDGLRDLEFNQAAQTWTLFMACTIRSNEGGFRALFAANQKDINDYVSGINLDLGGVATGSFNTLNLEGSKHNGQSNLKVWDAEFGSSIITVTTGNAQARAWINGIEEGSRLSNDRISSLKEIRLGGRLYENPPGKLPLVERGYLDGDIAEFVFYREELDDAERESVEAYLLKKYGSGIPRLEEPTLEGAFEKLPEFRIGQGRVALRPIDRAVQETHEDGEARIDLESRLLEILKSRATRDAKDFICRKLSIIGSMESVPALGVLLADRELSHMARYALERIPGPESRRALREAFPKLEGKAKVGLINSLARLRDRGIVPALISALDDPDPEITAAAAMALGRIGDPAVSTPLETLKLTAAGELKRVAMEALIELGYNLIEQGRKADALKIFQDLESERSELIRAAALRGLATAAPEESADRILEALSGKSGRLRGMAEQLIRTNPQVKAAVEKSQPAKSQTK